MEIIEKDARKLLRNGDLYNMGNWKEAERVREAILEAKGVVIDGKYIPPILGKGFIHDRYSCDCGFTDKSSWQAFLHEWKNPSHKMMKNW